MHDIVIEQKENMLNTASDIKKVCAVGTGAMGATTALAFAMNRDTDIEVCLFGRGDQQLEGAMKNIRDALQIYLKNGLIEAADVDIILNRIRPIRLPDPQLEPEARRALLLKEMGNADLLIESISEDLNDKQVFFAEMDEVCPERTIFASNSSAIIPSLIANIFQIKNKLSKRADKFLGAHFWNPPHFLPLVETVAGVETSPKTMNIVDELLVLIGKKPLRLMKEVPGFIGNRIQIALLREALHILEEDMATREEIDEAVTKGFGRDLADFGLFEAARNDGLDKLDEDYKKIQHTKPLCVDTGIPPLLSRLATKENIKANINIGAKSKNGVGIYQWTNEKLTSMTGLRVKELIRHLFRDRDDIYGQLPIPARRPVSSTWKPLNSVESRLRHAMLREAFYLVDQQIATEAQVDRVIKDSIGRRLAITGPLESADMGGLHIFKSIFDEIGRYLDTATRIPYLEFLIAPKAIQKPGAEFKPA